MNKLFFSQLFLMLFINCSEDLFGNDVITVDITHSRAINIEEITQTVTHLYDNDKPFQSGYMFYISPFRDGYIAYSGKIQSFDKQGKLIREIASQGQRDNEYVLLNNLIINDDTVYIYDNGGRKRLLFDVSGKHIRTEPFDYNNNITLGSSILNNIIYTKRIGYDIFLKSDEERVYYRVDFGEYSIPQKYQTQEEIMSYWSQQGEDKVLGIMNVHESNQYISFNYILSSDDKRIDFVIYDKLTKKAMPFYLEDTSQTDVVSMSIYDNKLLCCVRANRGLSIVEIEFNILISTCYSSV